MNFPFYIARRYLVSRKSHNIITLISWVSMLGIATGTAALIIVLSVFNGFESVVKSLYSVFDPDLKITVAEGKTFHENDINAAAIKSLSGVISYTGVLEENALLRYQQQQYLAVIKGMDSTYQNHSPIDSLLVSGDMILQADSLNFCIPGYGVAYFLGIDLNAPDNLISVYMPSRTGSLSGLQPESFRNELIKPAGIFSIQQDFDDHMMLVPLRFARSLLDYTDELSSVEIRLAKSADLSNMKFRIKAIAGQKFIVRDRFEQQEVLYKIMKSEKWAVFLILAFIVLVASFNVIGSLTMLILDKKKDITILSSMGATTSSIRRIFFTEGLLITLSGAIAGLLLGFVVCWLQQHYGFVKLHGNGSFILDAYPVQMKLPDFIYVFLTVGIIGVFATAIPSRRIKSALGR